MKRTYKYFIFNETMLLIDIVKKYEDVSEKELEDNSILRSSRRRVYSVDTSRVIECIAKLKAEKRLL